MTTHSACRRDVTPWGGSTDASRGSKSGRGIADNGNTNNNGNTDSIGNTGGNPEIASMIAQQLQDLLPTIVTQIKNSANNQGNMNGGGEEDNTNGENNKGGHEHGNLRNKGNNNNGNGCSYKEFMASQTKEFDGKDGAIAYTRWVEKMELVIDMSNCAINQRVKYVAGLLTKKPGHVAKDCRATAKRVTPVNAINTINNPRACYECGSHDHFRNTYPKLNRAPGGFDAIVGVDWLSKLRTEIVCHERVIHILLPNGEILEVHGERLKENLKHLVSIKADEKKLEDISIVRDFPKVSLKYLTRLPAHRLIELQIDLIPKATLIAKASYHLEAFEMQELPNQLQELQDKGFIRPSHLPWGAPVLFVKKKDGSLFEYEHVVMNLTCLWPPAATVKNTCECR
nr:putative reverse transcriptase domain-containing protein [Tanacetum cinerariifolium]